MKTIYCLVFSLLSILSFDTYAQGSKAENLRVFIDCQTFCDQDYIKRELPFVDYVNDRFQANVYLLVTSQRTGSGGREYKLQFDGQEKFVGLSETKSYVRQATATDDEDRKQAVEVIKLGLLPYLLKTDKAKDLIVSFKGAEKKETETATAPAEDPWSFWVFNLSLSGNFNGDKNYSNKRINSQISASRVTDKSKTDFSVFANKSHNRFGQGDAEFTYSNERYGINNTTVWSLTPHLSAGGYFSAQRSDFSNYDLDLSLTPAIEYNFFPYSESNNRYIGLMYKVGPRYMNYREETIFSEMEELRMHQSLSLDVSYNQKWGQVSGSTSYSHFFHDFTKKRVSFSGYADIRLVKGLSFNVGGSYAIQRDQLNIIKGKVSDQDLLTRRRQLDSNYNFFVHFGIRYRFGSLFNNVVNPRFGGGGNNMYFF
jgi:hypothetical protein